MSELITRTARLVPYAKRPRQVPSFVTAYSYEPPPDDPNVRLGNLYIVLEALVSGRASEEVAELVIETIGDQYYNQSSADADALSSFEAAIKALNRELGDYVNKGNAAWIGKLSAAIAVQANSDIHVAHTGSAEAFLYRGKASTQITAKDANRPSTPSKTFGSIATGQLEAGDKMLLATPALIHQIPLDKLRGIIADSGPNAAISEITDLLKGTGIDRIAALIIEITTPELAALQVRSDEPSEIKLGSPENALEAARIVAAPIAQSTVEHSKKVATIAQSGWNRSKPRAKALGLVSADLARQLLAKKENRNLLKYGLLAIIVIITATALLAKKSAKPPESFNTYQSDYTSYETARQDAASGNATAADSLLSSVQSQLMSIAKDKSSIDQALTTQHLPAGEPRSYDALQRLITGELTTINDLVFVKASAVLSVGASANLTHLEVTNGTAYVFDASDNNRLYIVDLQHAKATASLANTSTVGKIVSTTLSSQDDGIFIYTDTPQLWFYRFSTDAVTPVNISGKLPAASQIASYDSNLYFLSSLAVYKSTLHGSQYSNPEQYLPLSSPGLRSATSLAVDGAIYVVSPTALSKTLAGSVSGSSAIPPNDMAVSGLRSYPKVSTIMGIATGTNRVIFWSSTSSGLKLLQQSVITNSTSIADAAFDQKTNSAYAIAQGKVIRFPLP